MVSSIFLSSFIKLTTIQPQNSKIMASTPEANVKRMHEFCRLLQQEKRIDLFDEYFHPDFQDHPLSGGTTDRDMARKFMENLHVFVDDLEIEVVDCVGQGDMVATHKICRGRLNADFLGFSGGQKINLRVMDFMRIRDGRIVEHWATQDPVGSTDA